MKTSFEELEQLLPQLKDSYVLDKNDLIIDDYRERYEKLYTLNWDALEDWEMNYLLIYSELASHRKTGELYGISHTMSEKIMKKIRRKLCA